MRKLKPKFEFLYVLFVLLVFACPAALADKQDDTQSTSGPEPSKSVLKADKEEIKRLKKLSPEERERAAAAQHTIAGVPEYVWRHGCGPTAVGMVVGYYDGKGYNLIPGDASTQTNAVDQAMASGGDSSNPNPAGSEQHYEDYSSPEDVWPNMKVDDYITKVRAAHTDDCIGDYLDTSKSTRNNYYGWSWFLDIGPSFVSYVNLQNPGYSPSYQNYKWSDGTMTWAVLVNEIDNGRPMVFLVDTDGDGSTDHFVPIIGYDDGTPHKYACYTTWSSMPGIRWYTFQGVGNNWGVWGGTSFSLGQTEESKYLQPPDTSDAGMDLRCDRA
ncbi:MAG: cysteine peptidase family C39 domain-containing protein, partial [Planctomycetota bacterium]